MGLRKYSLASIGPLRQGEVVRAGQRKRIFYLKIPTEFIAFINYMSNTWYPDVVLELYIDGSFEERIERKYESRTIDPPIVVKNKIEVWAINNSNNDYLIEFEVDGVAVLVRELGLEEL